MAKAKKAKKTAAKKSAPKTKAAAGPRESVAQLVRDELVKGTSTEKILEKCADKFPKKKPTPGYVNWIREHAMNGQKSTQKAPEAKAKAPAKAKAKAKAKTEKVDSPSAEESV